MQINLQNKTAVVTGSTSGIGFAIAKDLAETVAGTGVAVNAVLPGPTASDGAAQFVKDLARDGNKTVEQVEQEFFAEVHPSSLIKRFETVEEIANMVVFVSSKEASGVTDAALRVDSSVVRSII